MEYDIDALWLRELNDDLDHLQRQEERLHAQLEAYDVVHRQWRWPAPLAWPPADQLSGERVAD
ncbi:MAG TPA: hypothetical protein VKB76_06350 [Ktedonobacterales bacterium]|nr:hypothetical protein [Ktedonobacterales bacterium]